MRVKLKSYLFELSYRDIRENILTLMGSNVVSLLEKKEEPETKDGKKAPTNKANKPTFPMDFILTKYPQLKAVLNDLLTVTFKDYIENIYVIAPKPTTFKVVLKNQQHFFLIYDVRSYQVKAAGNKYYLLNLGEKERAIKAIADLLSTKPFITSKDADEGDVEKEVKDKSGSTTSGGDFPGGGGDDFGGDAAFGAADDGSEVPSETGADEEEGEDTEELKESSIIRVIRPINFAKSK